MKFTYSFKILNNGTWETIAKGSSLFLIGKLYNFE